MAETSKDFVNDASRAARSTSSQAQQRFEDLRHDLEDRYHVAQERARQALSDSTEYVKANPVRTVLGAAAIGFVAGLIARRRRH
ncbi:MAG: DUF883 family protein [Bdellovibrio sp.]|nr:DUF883 family protein [Bdellovibrio sp.]